jgi:hypothetical protein
VGPRVVHTSRSQVLRERGLTVREKPASAFVFSRRTGPPFFYGGLCPQFPHWLVRAGGKRHDDRIDAVIEPDSQGARDSAAGLPGKHRPARQHRQPIVLGDSLTEGVPHANGETETYPYMTAQQLPGEAGDFLTAAAGRNFRAHNCVSAFVGISWMIFPAVAVLFSKGD